MDNNNSKFIDTFNEIINNYKQIKENSLNLKNDLNRLENIHKQYVTSEDKRMQNFGIYVDDIRHQITILEKEYICMDSIFGDNINKFYRDLFKLYNKIVKFIMFLYKDNSEIITKIHRSYNFPNINEDQVKKIKKNIDTIIKDIENFDFNNLQLYNNFKKKYYKGIRIYNELNENIVYSFEEINVLMIELIKRLDELSFSGEIIQVHIIDVKSKIDKGISAESYIIDLTGKYDKIKVELKILKNILNSVLNIHLNLSNKYKIKTNSTANEITYGEDNNIEINLPALSTTLKIQ